MVGMFSALVQDCAAHPRLPVLLAAATSWHLSIRAYLASWTAGF